MIMILAMNSWEMQDIFWESCVFWGTAPNFIRLFNEVMLIVDLTLSRACGIIICHIFNCPTFFFSSSFFFPSSLWLFSSISYSEKILLNMSIQYSYTCNNIYPNKYHKITRFLIRRYRKTQSETLFKFPSKSDFIVSQTLPVRS